MSEPLRLEVRGPNRPPQVFAVDWGAYTIGRDEDCGIRLSSDQVESRHAILTLRENGFWIEDLNAPGGTLVDGRRIGGRIALRPGQEIRVGPFALQVQPVATAPQPPVPGTPPAARPAAAPPPEPLATRADLQQRQAIKQQIHHELVERLDIKRLTTARIDAADLRQRALKAIREIVEAVSSRLPAGLAPEDLIKEICDEALGLGPIEGLLADPDITEIMVNGPGQVYVERAGRVQPTTCTFMNDESVLAVIERIVSPIGRRIDESQPYVDARLPDGSRVNAIIPPLSLVGPCLTIRKFSKIPLTDADLMAFGTLTPFMAEFARICVQLRKNIIVSGGTGSGKTTLLNVLGAYLPESDRIITIEDAAELRLTQVHVVRLESRPPNIEGKGAITIRDLVRNALRMRPDRIIVGECRGGEALDMLQAMNTGHDGSLTTIHANSPRDVLSRLETLVLMSGMDLPVRAIREQVASAIDIIVHESRFSDGSRKVTNITEVVGQEGDQITMQDIFEYVQTGVDGQGKVVGHFRPTGSVPTFLEEVRARGLQINQAMFDPQRWT